MKDFIAAVAAAIPPGGQVDFEPYTEEILELACLAADSPGNGWGTQTMGVITTLADTHKVNLMVIPAGISKAAAEPLTAFYERFGFSGEDALHRPHQ